MKKGYRLTLVAAAMALSLSGVGIFTPTVQASAEKAGASAAEQKQETKFVGKIIGVSKKAKTIAMTVGKGDKARNVLVKFTKDTKGIEHAKKGEKAIVMYKVQGKDKIALEVKPKLAKLPKGVTEMQPDELAKLVALGPEKGRYMLIDSRPAGRYAKGHVPTAVSIPVKKLKEKGAELLPADKDFPLIFHCGGPT